MAALASKSPSRNVDLFMCALVRIVRIYFFTWQANESASFLLHILKSIEALILACTRALKLSLFIRCY